MGEKSFDHSKKFLFNKLRRTYHLKEEPKPAVVSQPVEINEIASQAETLLSPTIEATVYTPRFRAGGTTSPTPGKEVTDPEKTAKPAFTPRFKATPPKSQEKIIESEDSQTSDLRLQTSDPNPLEKPKPAYVPRFKAPATKPAEEIKEEKPIDKPKPAYVPRFKAPAPKPAEETKEEKPTDKPKPAYVPRFKAPIKPAPDTTNENTPDNP